MKFTKLFLFTLLVIFSLGFIANVTQAGPVSSSVTVTVTAPIIPPALSYTITASAGTGGSISPSGTGTYDKDYSTYYLISADSGYSIQNVKVDGVSQGAISGYAFYYISANHSITATFVKDSVPPVITYTITASAGTGGSISPSGSDTYTKNWSKFYSISANSGYSIQNVVVDGSSQGAIGGYAFYYISANHSISATFSPISPAKCTISTDSNYNISSCSGICANGGTLYPSCPPPLPPSTTYTINASAGTGGSISPSGSDTYTKNWSKFYSITSNSGYKIKDVTVDGVSKGVISGYAFYYISTDHDIRATFSPNAIIPPVVTSCGNGATNPPTCNSFPPPSSCGNGATNPPTCNSFPPPPPTCGNGATNPPTCNTFPTCPAPTTKIITGITCDPNANGDAAISGSVTRQQTKTAPSCTFGTPVDNTNSTYVSNTCKYPTQVCANGAVNYSLCTIDNSGNCINGATNPSACTNNPTVGSDGKCLNGAVNPILCTVDNNNKCLNGYINPPACTTPIPLPPPSITLFNIMSNGTSALSPKTIKYNTRVNIAWTSLDATSCACTSADKKGIAGPTCGDTTNNNPGSFQTLPLKKSMIFTLSCSNNGTTVTDSKSITVDDINTIYKEN